MKRKSGRVILLFGVLVVILLAVAAYLLFGTGGGDGGGGFLSPPPAVTATPKPITIVQPVRDIETGYYITSPELFRTEERTEAKYAGAEYLHELDEVVEKVALVKLLRDEPVRVDQLDEPGLAQRLAPGKRAFALEVDLLSGIMGHLKKNDYVDVVLSGRHDEYFPQEFPLAIEWTSPEGKPEFIELKFPWTDQEPFRYLTVKTAIEDVHVLEVMTTTVGPARRGPTPTPQPGGQPGGWILILEVTPQQAEVLRFALDEGWTYQLILRPYGEHALEYDPTATTGITAWILLDPEGGYRMPIPRAIPYPITPGDLPEGLIP